MASTPHDLFPLATGLAKLVHPQIEAIIGGQPSEILERVTPVTADLLRFWFQQDYCDTRFLNFHAGQRAAVLHIIYAHEVLGARTLRDLYQMVAGDFLLETGYLGEVSRERNKHPKYCAKMATGTGKTWVLNALLIWQHLNHQAYPDDERFTSNFLLVAPGLIVYDRLLDSFQGKLKDGERDFETSDLYKQQALFVPENHRETVFGFLQSSVVTKQEIGRKVTGAGIIAITNWHLLAGQEDPDFLADEDDLEAPGEDIDPKAAVESFFPVTPGTSSGNSLDALDRKFLRGGPLQALKDLPSLVVFNDEAHHVHSIRKAEEVTDVEWQKALLDIASTKGTKFTQIDFSATPYNESGGKKKTRQYFAYIVVDFDLKAAMRQGLVKALTLDKRKEVAALPLDFRVERDEKGKPTSLSDGQRTMLRAGLKKLSILEESFGDQQAGKHPKMMVICEDTLVTPLVEDFLIEEGMAAEEVLRVDSGKRAELSTSQWEPIKEELFSLDAKPNPKVIVSVLMLREGFDVNNICVVVPLRSSEASILLEQTIGRGLRLMWRADDAIDELKRETRERIARYEEPNNFYDVLFVVEHPAFNKFYDDLVDEGLAGSVGDGDETNPKGDLEAVDLIEGYQAYDFEIPIIIRDADEEMRQPSIDPMKLPKSKYQLDFLIKQIGEGDQFVSHDFQTGTQYGDYRVNGGVMTAKGYNDYLARMTNRISTALGRTFGTKSAKQWKEAAHYPALQAYKPLLVSWLDTYIKHQYFGGEFDPFEAENWRVLLVGDVPAEIAGNLATKLVEAQENQEVGEAIVKHRQLSEVKSIWVRRTSCVEVKKCIYPKLRVPAKAGGLERLFSEWVYKDTHVEAFAKVDEYRHTYLHRPYLKADGMPALYSPDFLVRTAECVYVVETKAQSSLSDENVLRKKRAAQAWCAQINELPEEERDNRTWHYVLLGEQIVKDWEAKSGRPSELLDHARIRAKANIGQQSLL
ncbi:DEAD/DEAH box helicase family protein [Nocardia asteroides]|uniref:DEAD/DEAH box helicase family protein n=1 Tax=Nocardia asteroides TaxID=1824 RepID=UPI0033EEEF6D